MLWKSRGILLLLFLLICAIAMLVKAYAHDQHYADKYPLTQDQRNWFDGLKSGKGPCCGDVNVDGNVLRDNDWESKDGHYRVFIEGIWYNVPDEAVLKVPNMYGPTMVWTFRKWNMGGGVDFEIRCFMPGMMT